MFLVIKAYNHFEEMVDDEDNEDEGEDDDEDEEEDDDEEDERHLDIEQAKGKLRVWIKERRTVRWIRKNI